MNQDDAAPEAVESSVRRHPGHELAAARERAGISFEAMATTLHLPADQVRALEADEYSRLPPPAYVRGYLRAYAREVGMDADEVVAHYDAIRGEVEEPELVVHQGVPDPAGGRGPVLALLLVGVVAVAGALAWWLQQSPVSPVADSGDGGMIESADVATGAATEPVQDDRAEDIGEADRNETAELEPTEPEAPETGDAADAEPVAAVTDMEDAIEETAAEEDPATEDTDVERTSEAAGGEEAVDGANTAATGEAVPESMIAEGNRPNATSRAEEVATAAAGEGPDQLRIEVDGQSWLEIFDARGRQLAYTLYSGDEPVVLNGWAPFDVMLGNSHDVTLRFGDLEIDHSAFVRSDSTARFLVDGEGASRR